MIFTRQHQFLVHDSSAQYATPQEYHAFIIKNPAKHSLMLSALAMLNTRTHA